MPFERELIVLSLPFKSGKKDYQWFNTFFFFFIGREPTMWPANNCLQIMVCSCTVLFKCVLPQNNILLYMPNGPCTWLHQALKIHHQVSFARSFSNLWRHCVVFMLVFFSSLSLREFFQDEICNLHFQSEAWWWNLLDVHVCHHA